MPAAVSIASTHVHAMRLTSGAEALVARVVTTDGVAGYGFSLGPEATPARDMAQWDALGRSRNLPLYALFGKKMRERIDVVHETDDRMTIDPFAMLSIEAALAECRGRETLCLVAPGGHPWELSYCVALAAALSGDVRILVSKGRPATIVVSDAPGIDIDWSLEPGFAAIRWYTPRG
jgi:L-alanine-DL-glutamate epimerase-like enolase superfamily enzyme